MEKLLAVDRQQKIVELLNSNGSMKVQDLAKLFQVSKETIRRDLAYLSEKGLVKKSHGGALSNNYELNTVSLESRIGKNMDLKMQLCKKALEYIPPNGVIYLDTGSTIHCLAELLSQMSGYTIVTASLNVANTLVKSNNRILLTGGQLNPTTMAIDGLQTIDFISKIKVDTAFLGTNGFEQHNGPAGTDFSDVQAKQTIVRNSRTNIVISESRKASYSALLQYADWRDIDYFITDSDLPLETKQKLDDMTTVIIVQKL
ncbi:DeoR family transcriptional regulator [Thermoanaerobacterium thermosaccharolyticum]|uniref:DeoR family transcriptional regulator n=1 Tax=Thermoanaerobacterium thermosaccharolyticum TaxID=1517 RepID=A0A223HZ35_THETR|nr:DeoR/GlpR family DNA-binding transcription regulator [Thermoanaerobacterium thermosaccharolyticum]AST57722.1 DeoR family transcriptional regulator [Thermoanaerobacterium thermosaccharolyticum]